MFSQLEQILLSFADQIHLAIFSPTVSFIEEIIPPIPSPSVMMAAGIMAQIQGYGFYSLIFLAILGAVGKTVGASLVYYIVDKAEDIFASKIKKLLGITQEQIENLGARLSRNWKDYLILISLRALPIMPSSLISVGCGLLKIRFKLFAISTFFGSIIRDFIYIYLGYTGTKVAMSFFKEQATSIESIIEVTVIVLVVIFLGYLYFKRRKN